MKITRSEFNFISLGSFFKVFSSGILLFLIALYLTFLFLLPKFVTESNVEYALNNYLSKNTKLTLDIENLKIKPDYKFDINITADSIRLKYPSKNNFLYVEDFNADVNIFTLLFNNIDLNKIKIKKIQLDTKFTKNKKYDCFDYFDLDIFDLKAHKSKFQLRNVKVNYDLFTLNLFDENLNKAFYIDSKKGKFYVLDKNKPLYISSNGIIKSSDRKISDYKLDLEIILKQDAISSFKTFIKKLNYNPLQYADSYSFYSNTNVKLKINELDKKTNMDGIVSLTNFTFKINNTMLPKNNISILFKGDKINADCNFKLIKDQFVKLKLLAQISKNKFIELKINSNDINLAEFKEVSNAFAQILYPGLAIKNVAIKGDAKCDLYIKSDFNKIISKGKLDIINASITDKISNITLNNINSSINFADNKINIINTSAFINNSKFYLSGTVDENTRLDLKINSDRIDAAKVINLIKDLPFASKMAKSINDYEFKNGCIKLNADIKGTLKAPMINAKANANDIAVYLKPYNSNLHIKEIIFNSNNSKYIDVKDLKLNNDIANILIPNFKVQLLNDTANIIKTTAYINGSKTQIDAAVDYKKENILLNLISDSFIKNDFLVIKNKNLIYKLSCLVSKTEIKNIDLSAFDKNKKVLSIQGNIDSFDTFNNLKITILDKINILIPKYNSIEFASSGNLLLNGKVLLPNITGELNLYNIACKQLNLYANEAVLSIKNSIFDFDLQNLKLANMTLYLGAKGKLAGDKLLINLLKIYSPYIDFDLLQKNTNNYIADNLSNIKVDEIQGSIDTLQIFNSTLSNCNFTAGLNANNLAINKLDVDAFKGKISGKIYINTKNYNAKTELVLKSISVRHLPKEIKDLAIATSGKLSALINAEFVGCEIDNIIKTLDGYIKFNIDDGELAQAAKLERFLQAGNILSQGILKLTLNSTISAITNKNTGDFKTIEGTVKLKNGQADIQYIKTIGTNMSLYITGKFNLLNHHAILKVLGRIPSSIVNVLGNVGKFSTSQLVEKMKLNTKTSVSPIQKMLSVSIPDEDIQKIPPLANQMSGISVREFIVHINGDIQSISSIKFFKWRLLEN